MLINVGTQVPIFLDIINFRLQLNIQVSVLLYGVVQFPDNLRLSPGYEFSQIKTRPKKVGGIVVSCSSRSIFIENCRIYTGM